MPARGRAAPCLLLLLAQIQAPLCVTAGKVLIWPGEFSHWLYMKTIIDELTARRHSVTVISHSSTPFLLKDQTLGYNMEIIQAPYSKEEFLDNNEKLLRSYVYDLPTTNIQVLLKNLML